MFSGPVLALATTKGYVGSDVATMAATISGKSGATGRLVVLWHCNLSWLLTIAFQTHHKSDGRRVIVKERGRDSSGDLRCAVKRPD